MLKLKRCNEWCSSDRNLQRDSCSTLFTPPFAKELHVQIVSSPAYSTRGVYDSMLFTHFQTVRLVQMGDILCVSTEGQPDYLTSHSEGFKRWPCLYFKVKKILAGDSVSQPLGYLVDTEHTTLYLSGSTHSFVPWVPPGAAHPFWATLWPPGLCEVVDRLVDIVLPYLQDGPPALDSPAAILLWGPRGAGKITAIQAACARLSLHFLQVDCVSLCCDTSGATEARLQALFSESDSCRPCLLLLRNIHMLGKDRDGIGDDPRVVATLRQLLSSPARDSRGLPLIAMGTAYSLRDLSPEMQMAFLHEVLLEVPSEEQRRAVLSALTAPLSLGRDVNLSLLSKHTAGFVLGDFCALLSSACRAACRRVKRTCLGSRLKKEKKGNKKGGSVDLLTEGLCLHSVVQTNLSGYGAMRVPWRRVTQPHPKICTSGRESQLEHTDLITLLMTQSYSILVTRPPPPTAKNPPKLRLFVAFATFFSSVKGSSPKKKKQKQKKIIIKKIFSRARAAAPCIIFFDELDSLAPNRGRSGDSGGVTDSILTRLPRGTDITHATQQYEVFSPMGRQSLLDTSRMFQGRFDRLLYVGIGEDRESQLNILKAISRKFKVDADVSFSDIIEKCPLRLTGADMYALCSDAMMTAIKRKISRIEEGLDTEESELLLTAEDFHGAAEKLQPSVSELELQKYKVIRQKFAAR
uniref:ATPase AAA-type core domain-containing protein n=1 Tax=Latimeria chalumnae TaxID=7897 RepID=H3AN90_LATCH